MTDKRNIFVQTFTLQHNAPDLNFQNNINILKFYLCLLLGSADYSREYLHISTTVFES